MDFKVRAEKIISGFELGAVLGLQVLVIVILIDTEHTSAAILLGLAAVIIALTLGYFLVKRAQSILPPQKEDTPEEEI
jgi:hypothetical protein